MSPRKRRKSQAFPEADNEDATFVVAEEQQDRLEKEREIWDAFREEHFEGTLSRSAASKLRDPEFELSVLCIH